MGRITTRRPVTRVRLGESPRTEPDTLVVEEPLEIRVGGRPLAVTMRTPGNDIDLAAGFLVSEGIISATEHIRGARYCAGEDEDGHNTYNVLDVTLADVPAPDPDIQRAFYTTSSCGLCGKTSIDAVRTRSVFGPDLHAPLVDAAWLADLPDQLRAQQPVFDKTGGLHAAGLFDASRRMLVTREDVGRHNAVDKVIGWATTQGMLPLRGTVLTVSGRASFELVQKATMAGIPTMVAVSAPSSLAVELAAEHGMTVAGFVRGSSLVIYAGHDRVTGLEPTTASVPKHPA